MLALIDGLGWGGAEMLLSEFAAGASTAGIDLSVAYLRDKDASPAARRLRAIGIEPRMAPIAGLLHQSSLASVRRHIAEVAPDIVHTHLGYSDFLGGRAARSLGLPVVSTIHVMEWDADLRSATKLFLFARTRRHLMSRVIAVSQAARAAYLERHWDRPEHVVTVHNGIVGTARRGSGRVVRAQLGLGRDDVVIGMLSVLRTGKGHAEAIAALNGLAGRFPSLRLVILGDGPARWEIAALARRSGNRVVLAGHRDDVMDVLDAVDVLLHPSQVDAFPTALLEAMAASVPVVATAVGGIPEIVVAGETGCLVAPPLDEARLATALVPLLADVELRGRMGRAGRERFELMFTTDRWADRMRQVYEEAITSHRQDR